MVVQLLIRVQVSRHIIRVDVVVMVTPVQIRRVATLPLHLIQKSTRVVAAIARPASSQPEAAVDMKVLVVHILAVIMMTGAENGAIIRQDALEAIVVANRVQHTLVQTMTLQIVPPEQGIVIGQLDVKEVMLLQVTVLPDTLTFQGKQQQQVVVEAEHA